MGEIKRRPALHIVGLRTALVLLAFAGAAMTTGVELRGSAAAVRVPAWKVVYSRADGGLSVWTSGQRRAFRLTPKEGDQLANPSAAWSPDGKYVAFSHTGAQPGVYVVRLGQGSPRRLIETYQYAYDVGLAWSPDGQKLAFSIDCDYAVVFPPVCSSGRNGTTALYTIDPDGSHLQQVTAVPREFAPVPEIRDGVWSPDGRRIAYIVTSEDGCCGDFLYTIDASGGTPRLLAQEPAGSPYELGAPSWSPNGRWIAYGDNCYVPPITSDIFCDLVVQESSGGRPRVLLRSFGRRDTGLLPPAWTPDSRTLLYSQHGDTGRPALLAVNVQSGHRRVVLRQFADVIAPSRDDHTFAFYPAPAGSPSVATLDGRILDRGPRLLVFAYQSLSLWIH